MFTEKVIFILGSKLYCTQNYTFPVRSQSANARNFNVVGVGEQHLSINIDFIDGSQLFIKILQKLVVCRTVKKLRHNKSIYINVFVILFYL